jgi:hypothetical protein
MDSYNSQLMPLISPAITGTTVTVQDLTSDTGNTVVVQSAHQGAQIGTDISIGSAAVISWSIPRHYRGGHPRSYIPGLTTACLSGNALINAGFAGQLIAFGNYLLNAVSSATYDRTQTVSLCAVHRIQNKVVLADPLVDEITGCAVHARIDSQRRRLGKEG